MYIELNDVFEQVNIPVGKSWEFPIDLISPEKETKSLIYGDELVLARNLDVCIVPKIYIYGSGNSENLAKLRFYTQIEKIQHLMLFKSIQLSGSLKVLDNFKSLRESPNSCVRCHEADSEHLSYNMSTKKHTYSGTLGFAVLDISKVRPK